MKKRILQNSARNVISIAVRLNSTALSVIGLICLLTVVSNAAAFTATSPLDNGAGSLRQAILDSNAAGGSNTITVTVPAATPIMLATPLPAITATVTITGTRTAFLNGAAMTTAAPSANENVIGLDVKAPNTVISGLVIGNFSYAGIRIQPTGTGTTLINNYIGTNLAGTAAQGNLSRGVFIIGATGVIIGNSTAAGRNVISGNRGAGIVISRGGNATIRGNYIGVDSTGNVKLGNQLEGIVIADSPNSIIGGAAALDRNVISGNDSAGVFVGQSALATGNSILGNYIGTGADGTTAIGNNGSGVTLNAPSNSVGGIVVGARNVIANNNPNGITIGTIDGKNNSVKGNYIGVASNGTTAAPNRLNGVALGSLASNNMIGGRDVTSGMCNNSCNMIASNATNTTGTNPMAIATSARAGIYVDSSAKSGNTLAGNSIHDNCDSTCDSVVANNASMRMLGIGIDLGGTGVNNPPSNQANASTSCAAMTIPAPTALIPVVEMPNDLQNCPSLTNANTSGRITGTLVAQTAGVYVIDFYRNTSTDGAVLSEARTFVTSFTTPSLTAGQTYSFVVGATPMVTAGQFVTSTATNAAGSTSEISAPAQVQVATAAGATVGGRVFTSNGKGLLNAIIAMTDTNGAVRKTQTTIGGRYQFTNVPSGATYVLSVASKRYKFETQAQSINEDRNDINFTAVK